MGQINKYTSPNTDRSSFPRRASTISGGQNIRQSEEGWEWVIRWTSTSLALLIVKGSQLHNSPVSNRTINHTYNSCVGLRSVGTYYISIAPPCISWCVQVPKYFPDNDPFAGAMVPALSCHPWAVLALALDYHCIIYDNEMRGVDRHPPHHESSLVQ